MTQKNRQAYVLQLQQLLLQRHGPSASDLPAGELGLESRDVQRRKRAAPSGGKRAAPAGGKAAPKAKAKKAKRLMNSCGDEWEEDEEFDEVTIVASKVSEGKQARRLAPSRTLPRLCRPPPHAANLCTRVRAGGWAQEGHEAI